MRIVSERRHQFALQKQSLKHHILLGVVRKCFHNYKLKELAIFEESI